MTVLHRPTAAGGRIGMLRRTCEVEAQPESRRNGDGSGAPVRPPVTLTLPVQNARLKLARAEYALREGLASTAAAQEIVDDALWGVADALAVHADFLPSRNASFVRLIDEHLGERLASSALFSRLRGTGVAALGHDVQVSVAEGLAAGTGILGTFIDRWVRHLPALRSVGGRSDAIGGVLDRTLARSAPGRHPVMAVRPASPRQIVERAVRHVPITWADPDGRVLASVQEAAGLSGSSHLLATIHVDPLAGDGAAARIEPQAIVVSAGLLDGEDDAGLVTALNRIHALVRPGGKVVLTGLTPADPGRALLELVGGWRPHRRTAARLRGLFDASAFAGMPVVTRPDGSGAGLVVSCLRAS